MTYSGRRIHIIAVASIFTVATWLFVSLRVYVRVIKIKSFGLDDWIMCLCQLFFSGYMVCQLCGCYFGTGEHRDMLTLHEEEMAKMFWYICGVFYIPSTILMKVSVGYFLLRFTTHRAQNFVIYAVSIACGILGVYYLLQFLLQCQPVSYWWSPLKKPNSHCIDIVIFVRATYFVCIMNMLADLIFAVIPMILVWGTEMNLRTRLTVCCILGLGSTCAIATFIRIFYFDGYLHIYDKPNDFLWESASAAVLCTYETGFGIVAACAATLRPLLQGWLGHRTGKTQRKQVLKGYGLVARKPMSIKERAVHIFDVIIGTHRSSGLDTRSRGTVTGREDLESMPELRLAGEDDFASAADDIEKPKLVVQTISLGHSNV